MVVRKKSAKPLSGLRVLVTRARQQAPALSEMLRRAGASVIEIPVIEIAPPRSWRPLDAAMRQLPSFDWLIVTSVNGVEAMLRRMKALRISAAALRRMKIAAIGPATRAALEKQKIRVHLMPREYVAESVAAALRNRVRRKNVLLVRAARARDVLPREL